LLPGNVLVGLSTHYCDTRWYPPTYTHAPDNIQLPDTTALNYRPYVNQTLRTQLQLFSQKENLINILYAVSDTINI
jgi:hypothetical protein